MLSVLAMACVMYIDGTEHCDIRTQYEANITSKADCLQQTRDLVFQLASNAFINPDVQYIITQRSNCYTTNNELDDALAEIVNRLNIIGATYTTTHY